MTARLASNPALVEALAAALREIEERRVAEKAERRARLRTVKGGQRIEAAVDAEIALDELSLRILA